MISRRLFWTIIILIALFAVFHSKFQHKHPTVQQRHETSVDPKERMPYHPPDRGLGTLDASREVRSEANEEAQQPQKTQEEIDRQ